MPSPLSNIQSKMRKLHPVLQQVARNLQDDGGYDAGDFDCNDSGCSGSPDCAAAPDDADAFCTERPRAADPIGEPGR